MIALTELRFDRQHAIATPTSRGVLFQLPIEQEGTMFLAALGYATPTMNQVCEASLLSLQQKADRCQFFGYRGTCGTYHYFSFPDGSRDRLHCRELRISRLPLALGLCLFVQFSNQQLTVADPQFMNQTQPEHCEWAFDW